MNRFTGLFLSALTGVALILPSEPQQAMAASCTLSSSHYRLIPTHPEGPSVWTDGKVYQGSYRGGEITLCHGKKIKPPSHCEQAYQWVNGEYKYQLYLVCNGENYEAKVIIFRKGQVVLNEGLYHTGKAY